MESYFATIFEDIRYERSLILLLSLIEPDILKQSKFNDHEIEIIKNLALEKLHRQRILKEVFAMDLLENTKTIIYNLIILITVSIYIFSD